MSLRRVTAGPLMCVAASVCAMNALKPRPSFQILVMSEESRLGREQIETAHALK